MKAGTIVLDGTAQQVWDSLSDAGLSEHCDYVLLQADESNAQRVFYGDAATQPLSIAADGSVLLPVNSSKDVYVLGTASDNVHILVW